MTEAQKQRQKKMNAAPKGKKRPPAEIKPVPEKPKDPAKGGRPPKYSEAEEMQKKIDLYFYMCDPHPEMIWTEKLIKAYKNGKRQPEHDRWEIVQEERLTHQVPYTITGLALALDMTREDLLRYQKKDKFYDTIKKAKIKVQLYQEQLLMRNGNNTGVIFNMKNNFGYSDEQKIEHSGNVSSIHDLVLLAEKELEQLEQEGK